MRRSGLVATALVGLAVTGCANQGPQRTAFSTPSSEQLEWQRHQARVTPAGAGAVMAAGLAMQLSGLAPNGQIVMQDPHHRKMDVTRTDASEVSLTRSRPSPSPTKPIDEATMASAGYPAPPATVPLLLKLPPTMQ